MSKLIGTELRPIMQLPNEWIEHKPLLDRVFTKASDDGNFVEFYIPSEVNDDWNMIFKFPLFSPQIRMNLVCKKRTHGEN